MIKTIHKEISYTRFKEYLQGISCNLGPHILKIFHFPFVILHLLAVMSLLMISLTPIDWDYFRFFRSYELIQIILFPAVILGSFISLFGPPLIYLYGKREDRSELQILAYAMTQAGLIALFISSAYKAITGRMGPEFDKFMWNLDDYSTDFAFGILRRGVFDGWPSGHAAIAWAMAIVLLTHGSRINISRQNIRYGLVYASYVAIGVSTNIHWLSDVIAGVIIGIGIGYVVGSQFEMDWDPNCIRKDDMRDIYWVFILLFVIVIFSIVGLDDLV